MRQFLAQLVSLFLGPLTVLVLMPVIIIYRQTANLGYALIWEVYSLIFIVAGVAFFLFGRLRGDYSDIDISKRSERGKFYLITLIIAFIYFLITASVKGFSFHLTAIVLSTFLFILVFTIVNNFIKASVHLGIVCAFVVSMGLFYGVSFFIPLLFLIPLIAWSRLELNKHTPKELAVGALLGSFITVTSFLIWRFLL